MHYRLHRCGDLLDLRVRAVDATVGQYKALFVDPRDWRIRYLQLCVAGRSAAECLAVPPFAVERIDEETGTIDVQLTARELQHSPALARDASITAEFERALFAHHRWPPYWESEGAWGDGGGLPAGSRLRRAEELAGLVVRTADGAFGRIADLVLDDRDWRLRYVELIGPGLEDSQSLLIDTAWIEAVDWAGEQARLELSSQRLREAPPGPRDRPIRAEDERRSRAHFGSPPRTH